MHWVQVPSYNNVVCLQQDIKIVSYPITNWLNVFLIAIFETFNGIVIAMNSYKINFFSSFTLLCYNVIF